MQRKYTTFFKKVKKGPGQCPRIEKSLFYLHFRADFVLYLTMKYPYPSQKKQENLEYGRNTVNAFCTHNDLCPPKIKNATRTRDYGYYTWGSSTIFVNERLVRVPVKTPGFSWSYTGYKADLTGAGIIAHETGHYVDCMLKMPSHRIKKIVKGEKCVSSYEPNAQEVFAESMKLFILNPDLLRQGRPLRYEFLKSLGLEPVIADSWQNVLIHAHPKLIAAAKNWIKQ
jgi:hypothetical protein